MTTNIWVLILVYMGMAWATAYAMTKLTGYMNRMVYSKYGNWEYFDIHVGKNWLAITLIIALIIMWPVSMPMLGTRILIRYWMARRQHMKEIEEYNEVMELVNKI